MNRSHHTYTLLLLCATVLGVMSSCTRRESDYQTAQGMIWNTIYNITFRGEAALSDSILPVLNSVGASVSAFDNNSVISKINNNTSDQTDSLTRYIYNVSRTVWRESDGAFDPTLGPLIDAWGFGKGHTPTADTLRIDSLMCFVGMDKTRMSGQRMVKDDPRLRFNFSAVAKGYGCDAVAAMLERNGVKDYLIEIGGEIRAGGTSPRHEAWRVSVDAPVRSATTIDHTSQCVLSLTDCGIATSGNYRNYHEGQPPQTGHTIDTRTGRPAATDVLSATVIAHDTATADAYATAVMAMGSKRALSMLRRLDIAALIVTADGKSLSTPAFDKYLSTKN